MVVFEQLWQTGYDADLLNLLTRAGTSPTPPSSAAAIIIRRTGKLCYHKDDCAMRPVYITALKIFGTT